VYKGKLKWYSVEERNGICLLDCEINKSNKD